MEPQEHLLKTETPSGGQANVRGILAQTLIALLDALLDQSPFEWLTLEPNLPSEKFDLLWKNAQGLHAAQVKTSINPFKMQMVDALTREMKIQADNEAPGAECRLVLVGHPAEDLSRVEELNEVTIEVRSQTVEDFIEQAAYRLLGFLDQEDLGPVKAWFLKLIVGDLVSRLENVSTRGTMMQRNDIVADLRRWVAESPHYQEQRDGFPPDFGRFEDIIPTVRPYLEYLAAQCQDLPLRGLDPEASDPRLKGKISLDAVYIGLDTTTPRPEDPKSPRHKREPGFSEEEHRLLSALEVVALNKCLVLLGDPGSGKSTFLNHLCLWLHQRWLAVLFD